ncbi:MAG: TMEM14 family protein [Parachlamydiales bacterium]|nr:TMEM14 family protein [Parachlamydiales bacterium]
MKTTSYVSFLYGIIVLIGGIMSFTYANSILSLFVEVFAGVIILSNIYFMMKEKKFSYYTVLVISFLLTIFYGYFVYQTNEFFHVIMAGISFFIFIIELLKATYVIGPE